ncbi:TadE/TadG family type IV pilus assembly protein [Chelativorans intermedius]|uniref:TadE/TadG family type IV pilus assembly protein n=1 Tax=Chelativorans intermedius TaxID=515947 RepID=A0ABV6D9M2_9HYPH|nr:TadE/TadG family type IV pilus assembly protein [Chelativorans intermedius]MCT8999157.1 pilus assembly protein [Chelativorans intermedius]
MNMRARKFLPGVIRRFLAERRGAVAVEFVFVAPLLLAFYFLTMEFSQAIDTNRKLDRTAILVGDLVAQTPEITPEELDAIMKIGEAVLQPYGRTQPEITVTGIEITDEQTPRPLVAWSRRLSKGSGARAATPGSPISVPKELISPGAFLIRAEATLAYAPVITWSESGKSTLGLMAAFDRIDMGERHYLRPRVSRRVKCEDC